MPRKVTDWEKIPANGIVDKKKSQNDTEISKF